ncbi:hypothetical protein CGRA01v4_14111 [Colletotrichum graminicola]|nr:hypothetical protein CGRA01v4_14111 [Colletotrichum graminicola]
MFHSSLWVLSSDNSALPTANDPSRDDDVKWGFSPAQSHRMGVIPERFHDLNQL